MKHYIITKDCTAEFSLDEGQIGKFYERIKRKSRKNGDKTLVFPVDGSDERVLVVLYRSGKCSLESANNTLITDNGVVEQWERDERYGCWDTIADIWDKIKCLDDYFRQNYSYITPIKIIPESVIPNEDDAPDAFDDFTDKKKCYKKLKDRGESDPLIDVFLEIVENILDETQNNEQSAERSLIESEIDFTHYPFQIQAASGQGVPGILRAYEASIEDATEPAEVIIKNVNEFRNTIYEGTMMALKTNEAERWHLLSVTKFEGKGWADIVAQEFPELPKSKRGAKEKEIERAVKSHRKNIGDKK